MSKEIAYFFQRDALLQQVRRTSMSQRVRPAPSAAYACRFETLASHRPQARGSNTPVRHMERHEQMTAFGARTCLGDVLQDCFAHLVL
jgi:hypothetical protein